MRKSPQSVVVSGVATRREKIPAERKSRRRWGPTMHFQTGWRQKFAVDRRSKHYQSKEAQMKKIIALTLALTGVAGLPCAALAAAPQNPATASFNVTITLVKQCSVTTPANISLGAYGAVDLISTTATGTTSFNLTCTAGTAYTIGFAGSD